MKNVLISVHKESKRKKVVNSFKSIISVFVGDSKWIMIIDIYVSIRKIWFYTQYLDQQLHDSFH